MKNELDICRVSDQLLQAGVDAGAFDSQGQKVEGYRINPSIDLHGFEEKAGWMGMQLDRGLRSLKEAGSAVRTRLQYEHADCLRDYGIFRTFYCLVESNNSNRQPGTLSTLHRPQLYLRREFPHLIDFGPERQEDNSYN